MVIDIEKQTSEVRIQNAECRGQTAEASEAIHSEFYLLDSTFPVHILHCAFHTSFQHRSARLQDMFFSTR